MIKHFIFAKLLEKFFKKAMHGDGRGLLKYFKIAIIIVFIILVLVIFGIVLLIQFIFGLLTHTGTTDELVKNINEIKIEESIEKIKEVSPGEVTTIVEQVKTKIAPYDSLLKEAEGVIFKATETVERFEKLIP